MAPEKILIEKSTQKPPSGKQSNPTANSTATKTTQPGSKPKSNASCPPAASKTGKQDPVPPAQKPKAQARTTTTSSAPKNAPQSAKTTEAKKAARKRKKKKKIQVQNKEKPPVPTPKAPQPSAPASKASQSLQIPKQPQQNVAALSKNVHPPVTSRVQATMATSGFHSAPGSIDYTPRLAKVLDSENPTTVHTVQGLITPPSNSTMKQRDPAMEIEEYFSFLRAGKTPIDSVVPEFEHIGTAPIVSWEVMKAASHQLKGSSSGEIHEVFPQYGLLGENISDSSWDSPKEQFNPIFLNTNAPWSAFLCGSQGSGKSHTLSCILESCLMTDPRIGTLKSPLAGLMFFYDPHASSVCEAAHLASAGVKVRVLVSPSNYTSIRGKYMALPGSKNIDVKRFYLSPRDLTTERIKKLMGTNENAEILYMETIIRILRDMRLEDDGGNTVNYADFRSRLDQQTFSNSQWMGLRLRLMLLESILDTTGLDLPDVSQLGKKKKNKSACASESITSQTAFMCQPGTLTILDLTDPFIDGPFACTLFEICLSLFLSLTETAGKIVALDEAHNYMDQSSNSHSFTRAILRSVREQRHKALRIVVATQEPTINPSLLDLCSVTIAHRFTSPQWMEMLKKHIGGLAVLGHSDSYPELRRQSGSAASSAPFTCDGNWGNSSDHESSQGSDNTDGLADSASDPSGHSSNTTDPGSIAPEPPTIRARTASDVFEAVMGLDVGQGLVFSPAAILSPTGRKMGPKFFKVKVRPRISNDGGRSIMAHGQ